MSEVIYFKVDTKTKMPVFEIINVLTEMLPSDFIRFHIGTSDGTSDIEYMYNCIARMPNIVVICSNNTPTLPPTIQVMRNVPDVRPYKKIITGNCFICATRYDNENGEFYETGLSPLEKKVIMSRLKTSLQNTIIEILQ